MKTFLTLFAAITLSAYSLVGVHATQCAICPTSMGGASLLYGCNSVIHSVPRTTCQYRQGSTNRACTFNTDGVIMLEGSDASCPHRVSTGNKCPACSH
ncbi:hypothetical protein BDN67DRAFT_976678 [Paxillus ammoniavirescens]|nr:hypothetical protein BDN67DRAFT_976678 [Paxillus ammoniavirescens]